MASRDFLALLDQMKDVHTRKNAGYAGVGATDPWANFRMANLFGVDAFTGCLVRMSDKFIRIGNVLKNPDADQVSESIEDTLMDLAVYCLIAICLWREAHPKK